MCHECFIAEKREQLVDSKTVEKKKVRAKRTRQQRSSLRTDFVRLLLFETKKPSVTFPSLGETHFSQQFYYTTRQRKHISIFSRRQFTVLGARGKPCMVGVPREESLLRYPRHTHGSRTQAISGAFAGTSTSSCNQVVNAGFTASVCRRMCCESSLVRVMRISELFVCFHSFIFYRLSPYPSILLSADVDIQYRERR